MLNYPAPDYSAWALAESLTVQEAACLWAGVEPTSYGTRQFAHNDPAAAAVAPRLRMLSSAIVDGTLKGDTSANALVIFGDHAKTLLNRKALMSFASSIGQRPAFLFETGLPAEQALQRPVAPDNVQGAKPAVAPVDRAVPARLPQAPPPPSTLRGGLMPRDTLAPRGYEPRPDDRDSPRPDVGGPADDTQSKAHAAPYPRVMDDDAVVEEVLAEVRGGRSSIRAAVLARLDRLTGASDDAKIRRITVKVRRMQGVRG